MRSDPRVGAISTADALHVWVVRSVRRGAKLWLHAVPGPSPATGPEQMPELEREIQNQTAPSLVLRTRRRTGCSTKCRRELGLLTISMTRSGLLGRQAQRSGTRHGTAWAARFS